MRGRGFLDDIGSAVFGSGRKRKMRGGAVDKEEVVDWVKDRGHRIKQAYQTGRNIIGALKGKGRTMRGRGPPRKRGAAMARGNVEAEQAAGMHLNPLPPQLTQGGMVPQPGRLMVDRIPFNPQ